MDTFIALIDGKLLKDQTNRCLRKKNGKNHLEGIIFNLSFTFLLRNVTGRATLPDSTVIVVLLRLLIVDYSIIIKKISLKTGKTYTINCF